MEGANIAQPREQRPPIPSPITHPPHVDTKPLRPAPTAIDPASPAFWPEVIAAAASNRRARIILEGSSCLGVSRVDARTTIAKIRVTTEVLAACRSSLAEIESIASQTAGHDIKIEPSAEAPVATESAAPRANINDHPLVKSAMELFGARILSVQPRQPADK